MAAVAPVLAPYVDSLVAYDSDRGEPGVHVGLPSTHVTLVVAVGEPLDVAWTGRPETRGRFWGHVSGLHAGAADIHHDGTMRGVQVDLTAAGARALLGVPASALAGVLLELGDVDPVLGTLPERLAEVDVDRRPDVVAAALTAAVARHEARDAPDAVGPALAALTRGVPVHRVADDVGYSRRHLGELVRREVGLTPKEYQRVARLQRAQRLARRRRPWAEVAVRAGYADQPHLTREWVALAGRTPTAWAADELPFVQDTEDLDRPG